MPFPVVIHKEFIVINVIVCIKSNLYENINTFVDSISRYVRTKNETKNYFLFTNIFSLITSLLVSHFCSAINTPSFVSTQTLI